MLTKNDISDFDLRRKAESRAKNVVPIPNNSPEAAAVVGGFTTLVGLSIFCSMANLAFEQVWLAVVSMVLLAAGGTFLFYKEKWKQHSARVQLEYDLLKSEKSETHREDQG